MNFSPWKLMLLPCLDSEEMAASRRRDLGISQEAATVLGKSAVAAARNAH
ncbi:hypothetical protein UC8_36280 [Roseimaritima ulvae]|uniref:Uncharacterized protein n=1 Tax=Roseimaritima ulvae TaxID=980254 RepID=A0A5B9R5U2_9BACT|nr:hypothetical protein UC8_36280 [Roseimaritima ulvae]